MGYTIWQNYDFDIESDEWKEYFEEMEIEPSYEAATDKNLEDLEIVKDDLNIQLKNSIIEYGTVERWDGTIGGYNVIESGNIKDILTFHEDCDYAEWYADDNNICCRQSHHDGSNSYTYRQIVDGMDMDEFEDKVYTESGRVNIYALLKYTKSILPEVAKVYGWEYDPEIEKREQVDALTEVGEWKDGKEAVDKFNDPDFKAFVNDFGTVTFGNNFYEISCQDHTDGEVVFHIEQYVPLPEYRIRELDNAKDINFKLSPTHKDVSDFTECNDFIRMECSDTILKDFYKFKKAIVTELVDRGMISFDRIDGYQELKLEGKGYLKNLEMAIHDYPRTLAHKDKLTNEEYDYLANHYVEAVIKHEAAYMENVKKPDWNRIHTFNPQKANEEAVMQMVANDFKDSRIVILADKMNGELRKLGKPLISIENVKKQLGSYQVQSLRHQLMEAKKQNKKAR